MQARMNGAASRSEEDTNTAWTECTATFADDDHNLALVGLGDSKAMVAAVQRCRPIIRIGGKSSRSDQCKSMNHDWPHGSTYIRPRRANCEKVRLLDFDMQKRFIGAPR